MATSEDFVNYVVEMSNGSGEISSKKMFGEYAIYYQDKVVGLICNNTFYVKVSPKGEELLNENIQKESPYKGAKPHFVIEDEIENRDLISKLLEVTFDSLPTKKTPKTMRGKK